eukprot:TRINITY_DN836_c3_g2_i1.p1 TRINITY_DN836_c3_g2~~TRINITY_DN836_c3_g2_i1.p1  ORF type:complete len:379 (+),score=112.54 TRINITY_DN836_c3_g2_i1:51-1139(+)
MRSMLMCLVLPLCSGYITTTWMDLARNPSYGYAEYVAEYKKSHSAEREAVFNANLKKIRMHNNDGTATYKMGLNEFTDWTAEEFRAKRLGGKAIKNQKKMVSMSDLQSSLSDLPASLDWRTKNVVTGVKNQGGCGSCWAFSATETIESMAAIAGGKLQVLSEQQIVSCSPNPEHCGGNGGCDGSTQPLAFNYTMKTGITLESDYPYVSGTGTTHACIPSKIKPVVAVGGYVEVSRNNYTALITALATVGPIAISAAAEPWQLYEGGVFSKNCGYDMDHGIQLVGYGTDGSEMYWIVRNSWGPNWGESGYIRIRRYGEGKEPCGMDNTPQDGDACNGDKTPIKYCGECAILSSSSYPTGVHDL